MTPFNSAWSWSCGGCRYFREDSTAAEAARVCGVAKSWSSRLGQPRPDTAGACVAFDVIVYPQGSGCRKWETKATWGSLKESLRTYTPPPPRDAHAREPMKDATIKRYKAPTMSSWTSLKPFANEDTFTPGEQDDGPVDGARFRNVERNK